MDAITILLFLDICTDDKAFNNYTIISALIINLVIKTESFKYQEVKDIIAVVASLI